MKQLSLLGYAPATKDAWPSGLLGSALEALDDRHGVFPNHVMTPLLGALIHLREPDAIRFLTQIKSELLIASDLGRKPKRYNVLSANIHSTTKVNLHPDIDPLLSAGPELFDPSSHLWVVVGFTAISALISHFVEGRTEWVSKDISSFNRRFLGKVLSFARKDTKLKRFFPNSMPRSKIAKNGIYFRLSILPWSSTQGIVSADIEKLLEKTLVRYRQAHRSEVRRDLDIEQTISQIRSIIPVPHNEIYQNYKEKTNPIGMFQDVFMRAQDPKTFRGDEEQPAADVYWRFVGKVLAQKLVEDEVTTDGTHESLVEQRVGNETGGQMVEEANTTTTSEFPST